MSIPRRTYTTVNGVEILTDETWRLYGLRHRTDGPAWRGWRVIDGRAVLIFEEWYLNGRLHRVDGPAWQQWDVIGGLEIMTSELWYLNNRLHRTDGPARREWQVVAIDGHDVVVLFREGWYLQDVKIHPRILRQPVRAIERWWLSQQARRQRAIEEALWDNGMTVFPGFMGLLREY